MQKLPVSFPGLSFCRFCPPGLSRSCRLPAPSAPMRSYIRRDAPDERESSSDRRESTLPAGGRASAPAAIIAHPASSDCRVLPLFREWRQRSLPCRRKQRRREAEISCRSRTHRFPFRLERPSLAAACCLFSREAVSCAVFQKVADPPKAHLTGTAGLGAESSVSQQKAPVHAQYADPGSRRGQESPASARAS